MNTTLCSTSAFFFYRVPPCVWELVSGYPDISTPLGRRRLGRHAAYLDYLPLPLHELVCTRAERHSVRHVEQHLASSFAPFLGIGSTTGLYGFAGPIGAEAVEVLPGLCVTSPLLTLLTLAWHMPVEQLCMAMYELCGTFSVLRLRPEHRAVLQARLDAGESLRRGGWEPVLTKRRVLTDLWRRPPLVTTDELRRFAAWTAGMRGHKRFSRAASAVLGVAASPLEVQTALRLGAPRILGGEGIGPLELNRPIRLSPSARSIASRAWCSADLCVELPGSSRALVIECQSRLIHDDPDSLLSDSDRTTALQSMGYTVALVTRRQIRDPAVYRHLLAYVAGELGIRLRPKTPDLLERERRLCRSLFMDWTRLGL